MTRLMRYDPIYDVLRPVDVDVLDAFFAPAESALLTTQLPLVSETVSGFGNLPLDMYETDDSLGVEATLPGFTQDEIQIEEQNGILTIRAEHQEAHEEQSESWLVHERSMQVYERTVPLPVEVKAEKAEATLENGVLHITLPKVESGKSLTNRIKISVPKLKLPRIGKKESKVKVKKG
jgi:HSP20 family protein